MVTELVSLALYPLIALAVAGLVIWRVVAMGRASRAPISNEECVACGSRDVTSLGPAVYRCGACGYEGGSGVAASLAERERAEIEAMGPEARRAGAIADLEEALAGLASVEDDLARPAPSVADVERARAELLKATETLRRAGSKLGLAGLVPAVAAVDTTDFAAATVGDALGGQVGFALNAAEASSLRSQARVLAATARSTLDRARA